MTLTLIFITDEKITGQEKLESSLFEANEIADLRIAAGVATRVEIHDEDGQVRSRRPRVGTTNA